MTAIRYNPLNYSRKLQENGMNQILADVIANQQAEFVSGVNTESVATKGDISDIKLEIKLVLAEMKSLENRMTIKFGVMMVGAIGILLTLLTLLKHT